MQLPEDVGVAPREAGAAISASNYPAGGTRITINDQGAPPVLVNLRLRQAFDHLIKGDR